MSIQPVKVAGDGSVFRCTFDNSFQVMEQGGVIVAANVDRGISPLGVSARVTYDQTQDLLINATQMTIAMRFRTSATVPPGVGFRN